MKKLIPACLMLILVFLLAVFGFGQNSNAASAPKYFAYVANAGGDGSISAYSINPATGALSEIKGSPFPADVHPKSMVIHPNGKFLYVANYQGYNISAYTINPNTGSLTAIKGSPYNTESPILIALAPSSKFLYTANLEGYITVHAVNQTTGVLTAIKGSPFRIQKNLFDLTLAPTGKIALTINNERNSIITYSVNNKTGILTKIKETQIKSGKYPGSITLDPTGKFALVINYDTDNLSIYSINTNTGDLTEIKGSPFNVGRAIKLFFALSGKYAYILSTNNIKVFSFDSTTGRLNTIKDGSYNFSDTEKFTSLTIDPNQKFLYATNSKNYDPESSNSIYAFSINATTGRLTEIKGSPFESGDDPSEIITVKK